MAKLHLERFKYEVADELGYFTGGGPAGLKQQFDREKYEVANELGIDLKPGYNGDLTTREAGRIGGRLGGHLGGQMVKRMIELAERQLSQGGSPE